MILAIDIGNSAVKGAFFEGESVVSNFRLRHGDDLVPALLAEVDQQSESQRRTNAITLCSVVPSVTHLVTQELASALTLPIHVVSHESRLPVRLAYRDPSQLGADRIAVAAGAFDIVHRDDDLTGRTVLAIDAGTAVTFNLVDASGAFRGGAIWAGPDLVARALTMNTAQLPSVDLEGQVAPIADNTEDAIRSAVLTGFLEGSRGIVRRMEEVTSQESVILITGGRGALLADVLADRGARFEPHLVLKGVRAIAAMNDV